MIPNLAYLDDIAAVSPDTPQFIYTNVSNIYLNLVTDWNAYADRNGLDRESAFYHVNRATRYDGLSASAVPVNQFWGVYRGTGSRLDERHPQRPGQRLAAGLRRGRASRWRSGSSRSSARSTSIS